MVIELTRYTKGSCEQPTPQPPRSKQLLTGA